MDAAEANGGAAFYISVCWCKISIFASDDQSSLVIGRDIVGLFSGTGCRKSITVSY